MIDNEKTTSEQLQLQSQNEEQITTTTPIPDPTESTITEQPTELKTSKKNKFELLKYLKQNWFWLFMCIGISICIIIFDQLTKFLVVQKFKEVYDSIVIIPNVLKFTYVTNDGMGFGMLKNHRWVFMVLSTVAIIFGIIYLFAKLPKLNAWYKVSISMIISGGIGNMIDRTFNGTKLFEGVVVDFIDFKAFGSLWVWIFNVADIAVTVGVSILLTVMIIDEIKNYKKQKAKNSKIAENIIKFEDNFEIDEIETNDELDFEDDLKTKIFPQENELNENNSTQSENKENDKT